MNRHLKSISLLLACIAALIACSLTVPAMAQTQTDLTIQAAASFSHADRQLTMVYRQLPRTPALIASERAWIAYRDAECRYAHHTTPTGSMYGMETAMCAERLTRQRVAVLRNSLAEGYGPPD